MGLWKDDRFSMPLSVDMIDGGCAKVETESCNIPPASHWSGLLPAPRPGLAIRSSVE